MEDFEEQVAVWRDRVSAENERVTTSLIRRGERETQTSKPSKTFPTDMFQVIYADPPWRYQHSKTESRAIENQYPTLSIEEICNLPISTIAGPDSILFLWATSPKLEEALQVLNAWGFTYKTCAVWDKERIGMGYYYRQQHELILVGTKGNLPCAEPANRPSSVIRQKRDNLHSRKPLLAIEQIEVMYPDRKKIELFCREPREGWSTWGNE